MVKCTHCGSRNNVELDYCVKCGNWLGRSKLGIDLQPLWKKPLLKIHFFKKLHDEGRLNIAFYIIMAGTFSLPFFGMFTPFVEGLASAMLFAAGIFLFNVLSGTRASSITGMFFLVVFYSFLGMFMDQAGNKLYNKPMEKIFCRDGEILERNVLSWEPSPGELITQQKFFCEGEKGKIYINEFFQLLFRFTEYFMIGCGFLFIRWIIWKIRVMQISSSG